MTTVTQTLLAHLRQHIGEDPVKRKALLEHCNRQLPEPVHRGTLHKYIHGLQEPRADMAICIMRWLQLEGVIKPGAKDVGLFIYTKPLKKSAHPDAPCSAPGASRPASAVAGEIKPAKLPKNSGKPTPKRKLLVF